MTSKCLDSEARETNHYTCWSKTSVCVITIPICSNVYLGGPTIEILILSFHDRAWIMHYKNMSNEATSV